jgi:hypothetical protein
MTSEASHLPCRHLIPSYASRSFIDEHWYRLKIDSIQVSFLSCCHCFCRSLTLILSSIVVFFRNQHSCHLCFHQNEQCRAVREISFEMFKSYALYLLALVDILQTYHHQDLFLIDQYIQVWLRCLYFQILTFPLSFSAF